MKQWIGYYENILSNKLCDDLIKHSKTLNLSKSQYANNKGIIKNSEERVKMDDVWFREGQPFFKDILDSFSEVIKKYHAQHELFTCQRHYDFRLNKYSVDGFMSKHIDNIHHSHGQKYGYPQVSALLFLNDDYEGGEFIVADVEYTTKKGSAIIFPSNFMFPHEVKIIKKGTRYSIVTWLI